jgi:hypothetical protein
LPAPRFSFFAAPLSFVLEPWWVDGSETIPQSRCEGHRAKKGTEGICNSERVGILDCHFTAVQNNVVREGIQQEKDKVFHSYSSYLEMPESRSCSSYSITL